MVTAKNNRIPIEVTDDALELDHDQLIYYPSLQRSEGKTAGNSYNQLGYNVTCIGKAGEEVIQETYKDAVNGADTAKHKFAVKTKIDAFHKLGTWEPVSLDTNKNLIDMQWVFDLK